MFDIKCVQNYRVILHIDADAFFASVEQAMNPKLRNKAIIVGGPSKRYGVVSTSSYEAKKKGVKSGMSTFEAFKLCPEAILMPSNFEAYKKYSNEMFKIFSKYTPIIEIVSIDEAYLDITGMDKCFKKSYDKIARDILVEVKEKLGITVSCGLSASKTVSKVATTINKPNKLTIIPFGKEREFLKNIDLKFIPFCGPKSYNYLKKFGFLKCDDLANIEFDEVVKNFGTSYVSLWKKSRGIDNSEVNYLSSVAKSISKEKTYYKNPKKSDLVSEIKSLAKNVFFRLRSDKLNASVVAIKFKYKLKVFDNVIFKNKIFQKKLDFYSSSDIDLYSELISLFEKNYIPSLNLRLVGVKVSGLDKAYNLSIFPEKQKQKNLFSLIDSLNNKFDRSVVSVLH